MRCYNARPQPAITLQWRSAYLIYDFVYVFALYGELNILFFAPVSHHTCPFDQHNNFLQFHQQNNSSISAIFLPFNHPQSSSKSSLIRTYLNFSPFIDFFHARSKCLWESFNKNKNWSRKSSWMHNLICTAYVNSRNLALPDQVFAAIIFQSKRLEPNQPQASGKSDGSCVCVAYPSGEPYCTSCHRSSAAASQTFDFVSLPLFTDKKNKTPEAAKQRLHEFYGTQRVWV